ncbi:MAG: hypothetical protein MR051_06885 [Lentisphaeria bacterium]|nr:hypothetical protein [Lentisphaeria bacterium]
MVKSVEKQLFLRDADGGVTPFDAMELQTRLIGAFLATGLREDSSMAEEIVLALEYTLLRSPRPEPVFSNSEVDTAIIRLLENTGFPEAAAAFRRTGSERITRIAVSPAALERLFAAHLGCSAERAARIAGTVADSLARLDIREATPHLLLEFARHYERDLAEREQLTVVPAGHTPPKVTLTREDIYRLLPEAPRQLADAGVLRINGITTLFPSVRFFFFMKNFAILHAMSAPVTELEVIPKLYTAGNALEEARSAILQALEICDPLPCCLAMPDVFDFLESFADSAPDPALAAELAGALTAGLKCELYNLAFD